MSIFGLGDQFKFLALDTEGRTHLINEYDPATVVNAADHVLAIIISVLFVIAAISYSVALSGA